MSFQTLQVEPPRGYYADHALFTAEGLAMTICLSAVPAHSPYRAGDWVRCHGYPGYPAGPQRWGFRGFVLGGYGSTVLRGLTDDGHEWAEHWGALVPDGVRDVDGGALCTCCPRLPRRYRGARVEVEQLGLFDVFDLLSKEEISA